MFVRTFGRTFGRTFARLHLGVVGNFDQGAAVIAWLCPPAEPPRPHPDGIRGEAEPVPSLLTGEPGHPIKPGLFGRSSGACSPVRSGSCGVLCSATHRAYRTQSSRAKPENRGGRGRKC